jgi:cystathionine beta-lyase
MDFKTAPEIIKALEGRANEGIWGYTSRPDKYFEAVRNWQIYKNNWAPETKYMSHALGVLAMLANICASIMEEGKSKVILQTPVFSEFKTVLDNWNMQILYNPLKEVNGNYEIDFEDLEVKAKEADFIIFCNPHNPIGKVWERKDIEKMAQICIKNDVMIISDEMYSDIMLWGNKHIPTASISEEIRKNTITCTSLGKTFNLAGLQVATCIFPSEELKNKYEKILEKFETKRNNAFSIVATQVAMNESREWFSEVINYLEENILFAIDYINRKIPKIKVKKPDGTYLLWLDCKELNLNQEELVSFFINDAKLGLNNGTTFGEEGRGYMRMNIASPKSIIEKALNQLEIAVNNL